MGGACYVILFLIICSMGISLNKTLTYGAKKHCLPNHIAQHTAEPRYEHQNFKENRALHSALVPQAKKLGTFSNMQPQQKKRFTPSD